MSRPIEPSQAHLFGGELSWTVLSISTIYISYIKIISHIDKQIAKVWERANFIVDPFIILPWKIFHYFQKIIYNKVLSLYI